MEFLLSQISLFRLMRSCLSHVMTGLGGALVIGIRFFASDI